MLRTTPPAVGRIYGRCRPGDRRWTIEFAPDNVATDSVTYRIRAGRPRTVNTRPSRRALTWRLVPDQFNSHEPADPLTHFPATTIKTTAPVSLDITQGTEPHIYRVNVRFAVAAAIGNTSNCALISTRLHGRGAEARVQRVALGDDAADLDEVVHLEAARGQRRRPDPKARGDGRGPGVEWDGVTVDSDPDRGKTVFGLLAVEL
jgi:hypothetical protein